VSTARRHGVYAAHFAQVIRLPRFNANRAGLRLPQILCSLGDLYPIEYVMLKMKHKESNSPELQLSTIDCSPIIARN